jgi:hypothetical protein
MKRSRKPVVAENAAVQETITITFGECAENHKGMEMLGTVAEEGFTIEDLTTAQANFEAVGARCELLRLDKDATQAPAAILVVRQGVQTLLANTGHTVDTLFEEQKALDWDKKAFMYGRVVDKHARHNLCFTEHAQEPDYEAGKGRVIAFDSVPCLNVIRNALPGMIGGKAASLLGEGNRYYNAAKCGIGYHGIVFLFVKTITIFFTKACFVSNSFSLQFAGDAERLKVVAIRLGAMMPLQYQWFLRGQPTGDPMRLELQHGDLYVMSQKATGNDWKKRIIPTLRHVAGESFIGKEVAKLRKNKGVKGEEKVKPKTKKQARDPK